jgi:hypothetical protein
VSTPWYALVLDGSAPRVPNEEPRNSRVISYLLTAEQYRHEMTTRFATWNEVVGQPALA